MNPGSISSDAVNGLIITGITGLTNDITFMTPGGLPIMRVPAGTQTLALTNPLSLPGLSAGLLRVDGFGVISSFTAVDLATLDVTGVLPVTRGGLGSGTFAANALLVGNGTSPVLATNLTYTANTLTSASPLTINVPTLTVLGKIIGPVPTVLSSSFNAPHGVAPVVLSDGDLWTTVGGLFARINGVTQGPFISSLDLSSGLATGVLPVTKGGTGGNSAITGLNGLLPSQVGLSGRVLSTDGVNASWTIPGGYSLTANSAQFAPADSTTYYFGIFASLPVTTTPATRRQYVPKSGTVRAVALNWFANAVAGSSENISMYLRVNDTTEYLIATVGNNLAQKTFINTAMNAPVVAGDYIEIRLVTPAWALDPTQVTIGGTIYVE